MAWECVAGGSVPDVLVAVFQTTFAVIAVTILAGSLAERIKFGAFLAFAFCWVLVAYAPICHWLWGGGYLIGDTLGFAGGMVVHVNAGAAGLVLVHLLGRRKDCGKGNLDPCNLSHALMGTGLLWFWWLGFHGGSALRANGTSTMALLVSQAAVAVGLLFWLACECLMCGKASALGGASGVIVGLVRITLATGFVGALGC